MAVNNALNLNATGIITHDGAGAFVADTVTEGAVLLGDASNGITDTGVLSKGTILVGDGVTAPTQLAVGTNDHGLTADSAEGSGLKWAAVTGGVGSLVYIGASTASASATIDFTGLSSTYFMYFIELEDVTPANDESLLYLRTSTDGGSTYDSGVSDYGWALNATAKDGDIADSEIQLTGGIGNAANEMANGSVFIINPSATNNTRVIANLSWYDKASVFQSTITGGERLSAADVDAIRFLMDTGNIAGGTFRVWGLKAT